MTTTATPAYHGGILSEFTKRWSTIQVMTVQHGLGERAKKNPNTGESIAGPVTSADEELAKNRINPFLQTKAHPFVTNGTASVRSTFQRSRFRFFRARTGEARAFTRGETSTVLRRRLRSRSGSKPTATRTGRSSPAATAWRCRSGSSITF